MDGIESDFEHDEGSPLWQNAVNAFLEEGFKAGDLVLHEWFHDQLGLREPGDEEPARLLRQFQFDYLSSMHQVVRYLLREHRIALASVRGEGYRVMPAENQVEWAERELYAAIKRDILTAKRRVTYVDQRFLNSAQRKERADALAKMGKLQSFIDNEYGKRFRNLIIFGDV